MSRCPNDATLESFHRGDLEGTVFERWADHVEFCPRCDARLAALEVRTDGLTETLRKLTNAAQKPTEPLAEELLRLVLPDDLTTRLRTDLTHGTTRVGRFEITELIGEGSFGAVFKARDLELERDVALKILRTPTHDPITTELLNREGRSAARLSHPGIVALHETGRLDDGSAFLVSEFIDGPTLEQHLTARELPPRVVAEIFVALADALDYAHSRGVVHRDLKPSNVVLDAEGRPHLTDFGLAKRDSAPGTETPRGEVFGTPAYMSPEQARGDTERVDAKSDVYSLGVMLYEALTRERPFKGNRRMLLLQVLEDDPIPPRRLDDRIPKDLETICLRAMARSRARRYPTAAEFRADVERFLRGAPIRARKATSFERAWAWCRANRLASGLFLAVTLGPAVGFLYLSGLTKELVEDAAIRGAATKAEMLEEFNHYYSDLIDRLGGRVETTHDYRERRGTLPLPATFLSDAARLVSERTRSGLEIRHYSDHPFPWRRAEGGARNAFERRALERLRRDPESPLHEVVERGGKSFLLYATARRLARSCVECHNTHPDSPKTDWQLGDVRGVLEIVYPMEPDLDRVQRKLRGAHLLVAGVSLALFIAAVLTAVSGRKEREARRTRPR